MFNDLRKPAFWLGVVVVVVALRWAEKMFAPIRAITMPGGNAA